MSLAIFVSSGTARVRLSSGKKNSMGGIIPINVWVGLCVNVRGRLQFRVCVGWQGLFSGEMFAFFEFGGV